MLKSVLIKCLILLPFCMSLATTSFAAEPILRNKVPIRGQTAEKSEGKAGESRKGKQKNDVKFKAGKGNCNCTHWTKAGKRKAKKD